MSEPIAIDCRPVADGWSCDVRIGDGPRATEHRVGVRTSDLERLDPGAGDPTDLVGRSFDFLLEREPKESILRSFDLMTIGRYFPEWEREVGGRR